MNLVLRKANPANSGLSLYDLHREMDSLFGDLFRSDDLAAFRGQSKGALAPRIDIAETDKDYRITAELPGVDEKDIDISVVKGTLTLKGEKKAEKDEKGKNFHRVERSYGAFERSFSLPQDADAGSVTADFSKGVLAISVAKKPKAQDEVRKVQVKSS